MLKDNIKQLRKQNGYTMKALGEMLGLTESSISYYEKGEREPSIGTLVKMSKLFSVSLDFLIGIKSETEKIPKITPPDVIPEKKKLWLLYEQLDTADRGEIRGEMKGMLKQEKYALSQSKQRA